MKLQIPLVKKERMEERIKEIERKVDYILTGLGGGESP